MFTEVMIIGLQLATIALLSREAKPKAKDEPKEVRKLTPTKVAPKREAKISNSGERFAPCPVVGFQSYYQVGNFGTVKTVNGKIVKPHKNTAGVFAVHLNTPTKHTTYTVERLVALAFLARPAHDEGKKHRILHRNTDRNDNRAVNLMWK